MIADLLNIEITDLATLDALPLGAIVFSDGAPYQRIIDGDWYVAGSDIGTTSAKLIRCKSLHLVWLPPEHAESAPKSLVHFTADGSRGVCGADARSVPGPLTLAWDEADDTINCPACRMYLKGLRAGRSGA